MGDQYEPLGNIPNAAAPPCGDYELPNAASNTGGLPPPPTLQPPPPPPPPPPVPEQDEETDLRSHSQHESQQAESKVKDSKKGTSSKGSKKKEKEKEKTEPTVATTVVSQVKSTVPKKKGKARPVKKATKTKDYVVIITILVLCLATMAGVGYVLLNATDNLHKNIIRGLMG